MKKNKIIALIGTFLLSTTIATTSFTNIVFAANQCKDQNVTKNSYKELMLSVAKEREKKHNVQDVDFSKLPKLTDTELSNFNKVVKNDKKFNLLIEKLYEKNMITEKEYKLTNSGKISGDNYDILGVNFTFGKSVITVMKFDETYESCASIIEEENNEIIVKLYLIYENELTLLDTVKYDKNTKNLIKKLPRRVKRVAVPVYGNWCGPGYGSGTPVDSIDACCKQHDLCYDSLNWYETKKFCDIKLGACLVPVFPKTTAYGKALIVGIMGAFGVLNSLPFPH